MVDVEETVDHRPFTLTCRFICELLRCGFGAEPTVAGAARNELACERRGIRSAVERICYPEQPTGDSVQFGRRQP